MTTSRVLAAASLLALAAAGCSSGSSDTPDPGALASSIQAQATSPAAGSATAGSPAAGGGNCADAPPAAKAALTGMDYLDTDLVQGCNLLSVVTNVTDPAIGQVMCAKVAGEVWQLGVKSIVVITPGGTELATAEANGPCTTS